MYNKDMNQIIPTAEPFFFPGSKDIGVLLIHGFTGAPKEMRWMGENLNREHGFTCLGIRLAGHATHAEDMIRSNYIDWIACVEDGYHMLAGTVKHVYLAGLSMGGVLSLHAAAKFPVRGVVAMSTPYQLPDDPRLRHIDLIAMTVKYMPKTNEPPGSGWFDKEAWKQHVSYSENPVRAIGQLNKLLAEMRDALPQVTAPALLIYSRDDTYVPRGSEACMEYIHAHLGSKRKEKMWIEGSGHVITEDSKREQVFKAAVDFINNIEQAIQNSQPSLT
jgi:carboxylesterase